MKNILESCKRLSLLSFFILGVLVHAITAEAEKNEGSPDGPTTRNECFKWGCPILPRDIAMDEEARKALAGLRSVSVDDEGNETPLTDEEMKVHIDALEKASVGDADKATLTLIGNKGGPTPVNQDRAIIVSPFILPNNTKKTQLLGVFDGHGDRGELTSQHAIEELPKLLSEKLGALPSLDDEESVAKILHEVFVAIDKTDPSQGDSGCTATVVLQLGGKLYIANAGDSLSFVAALIDGGQVEVAYETREDKPDLPDEKERIESMGGYVHIDPNDEDVPRAYYIDEDGQARYGVAMSRSLGDWKGKKPTQYMTLKRTLVSYFYFVADTLLLFLFLAFYMDRFFKCYSQL